MGERKNKKRTTRTTKSAKMNEFGKIFMERENKKNEGKREKTKKWNLRSLARSICHRIRKIALRMVGRHRPRRTPRTLGEQVNGDVRPLWIVRRIKTRRDSA
jgi:hypothetical protein